LQEISRSTLGGASVPEGAVQYRQYDQRQHRTETSDCAFAYGGFEFHALALRGRRLIVETSPPETDKRQPVQHRDAGERDETHPGGDGSASSP
jgi:hypothetical protein